MRSAFPVQIHVDAFVFACMAMGDINGLVWERSLASQHAGTLRGTIGHYDWAVGYKRALPDLTTSPVLLLFPLLLLLALLWRRTNKV